MLKKIKNGLLSKLSSQYKGVIFRMANQDCPSCSTTKSALATSRTVRMCSNVPIIIELNYKRSQNHKSTTLMQN